MLSIVKRKLLHIIPKKIIPESLFWRFVLIIIAPVLIVQILSIYVFYQRHWYNVTSNHSEVIANEVVILVKQLEKDEFNNRLLAKPASGKSLINGYFINLKYNKLNITDLPKIKPKDEPEEVIIFSKILSNKLDDGIKFSASNKNNNIYLYFKLKNNNIYLIQLPYKSITTPTTHLFVIWVVCLTIILLIVSMIFSKKQIQSMINLTNSLEKFGRGEKNIKYSPSGAREIRQAGLSFLKMKDRIERYNSKRTQMLAMISHDLRTPLTRIKLQVSMMDPCEEREYLIQDVQSMQHMIDSYLDFTKCEMEEEKAQRVGINKLILEYLNRPISNWSQEDIQLNIPNQELYANISPYSFLRAVDNILSNAKKYASIIKFTISSDDNYVILKIEDNGSGIDKKERNKVFKPFYRSDQARSLNKSSNVGLGLAISREIVNNHDGVISLGDSEDLKGLMVTIKIPKSN